MVFVVGWPPFMCIIKAFHALLFVYEEWLYCSTSRLNASIADYSQREKRTLLLAIGFIFFMYKFLLYPIHGFFKIRYVFFDIAGVCS